jgi:hypothetical protein
MPLVVLPESQDASPVVMMVGTEERGCVSAWWKKREEKHRRGGLALGA